MDLIILYWLLFTSMSSSCFVILPFLVLPLFCQLFKHFLRAEIKLVAKSRPVLLFSLFKDRHWLSLHEPFKTLPTNHMLLGTALR